MQFFLLKLFLICTFLLLVPFWWLTINTFAISKEISLNDVGFETAVVLGAGVLPSGNPSQVLQNRLDAAVELWELGIAKQIIVSGDNRVDDYNEPQAMENYLISQGVPSAQIVKDGGGIRTARTCWQAKNTFGLKKLILVSQSFHLPRAVNYCNQLGLEVRTKVAFDSCPDLICVYQTRELVAVWFSLWELFYLSAE